MGRYLRGEIVGGPHCGEVVEIDVEQCPLDHGSLLITTPSPRRLGVIFEKDWIAFIDRGPHDEPLETQ